MSQIKFDDLVAVYRSINFKSNSREGSLTISDGQQRDLVARLLSTETDEYGLKILQGNADDLEVGKDVELIAQDPKISIGIVATNLDDLLTAPKARLREPTRYFFIDEKFSKTDADVPASIERYRKLLALVALLKQAAAYLDEEAGELVFIQDGKFQLPVVVVAADLQLMDIDSLNRLLESFESDTHRDQKLAILARSVQLTCSAAKPSERLRLLLEHLPDLQKNFSEGYRLFVADFSYEKIVNQLEVAKLEEIGKIHKTFSDVQNQILGIPVATIVVATQMKIAETTSQAFWVNTAVLVGCWVFAILSAFILRNQMHTLDSIGQEITRKKQQMLNNYRPVADLITKSFPILEKRLKTQRLAFYAVDVVLVLGLILAHVVYFYLTDPARAWLSGLLGVSQNLL